MEIDASIIDGIRHEVSEGRVTARRHPRLPYTVYKYADVVQYDNLWNSHNMLCRGLVLADDGTVVARPYAKFFNSYEELAPTLAYPLKSVTEKVDGSCGILFYADDGPHIATPGSFVSEQAEWATKWFVEFGQTLGHFPDGYTAIFEIVYPGSRVVCEYDYEGLVLLNLVDKQNGAIVPISEVVAMTGWRGRVPKEYALASLDEILRVETIPNAEGFVLLDSQNQMVKVKFAEYVLAHRMVSGMVSTDSLYRMWVKEKLSKQDITGVDKHTLVAAYKTSLEHAEQVPTLQEAISVLPDEWYTYLRSVIDRFYQIYNDYVRDCTDTFDRVYTPNMPRNDFAKIASTYPTAIKAGLFALLDNKDLLFYGIKHVYSRAEMVTATARAPSNTNIDKEY